MELLRDRIPARSYNSFVRRLVTKRIMNISIFHNLSNKQKNWKYCNDLNAVIMNTGQNLQYSENFNVWTGILRNNFVSPIIIHLTGQSFQICTKA